MSWEKLLSGIENIGSLHAQTLVENLRLDLPGLSSNHARQESLGNNVAPENEASLKALIQDVRWDTGEHELIDRLDHLTFFLEKGRSTPVAHFLTIANKNRNWVPISEKDESFTRYVSAKRFFDLVLDPDKRLVGLPSVKPRQEIESYLACGKSQWGTSSTLWPIFLGASPQEVGKNGRLPRPIWITTTEDAPHMSLGFMKQESRQRAEKIVRSMGLRGYASEADKTLEIGIIAVEFTLTTIDKEIFKPTVLDAINSPFFRPGPKGERHGLTAVLNKSLDVPSEKDGVKEYICEVPLLPVKLGKHFMIKEIGYF